MKHRNARGVKLMPLALWIAVGAAILCAFAARQKKK